MEQLMKGKAGLVTGAGSGIGKASALLFAAEGAKVVVSDINEDNGNQTVKEIVDAGGEAVFFKCDVGNEENVKELVDKVVSTYGKLDFAHNNAGVNSLWALTADSTTEDWHRVIRVNLDGVYYAMKYEIQAMLKNGGGAIVNTSSGAGTVASPGSSAYVASKHGVNGITKNAAKEYAKLNIRVNSVDPGPTETPMMMESLDKMSEIFAPENFIPMGRLGTPEEQANTAVWLCSDRASFITGRNIVVDGGALA
jgi:Dehydrogenases with different specificities (related to short-chain alcohol dehydrogenases)